MSLKGKIKYLHVSRSLFAITQQPDFVEYISPTQRINDAVVVHDRVCIIVQNKSVINNLILY